MSRSDSFPPDWPVPSPAAQNRSRALSERIGSLIDTQGSIRFDRFMEEALYAPELGYYAEGIDDLGADGDFTTAPEVSRLFARCVAAEVARVLEALAASGPAGEILELGAGTGALARDLLDTLDRLGAKPAGYCIVETSPRLTAMQRDELAAVAARTGVPVRWLDRLPTAFRGVVVANEVLDALPCERFQIFPEGPRPLEVVRGTQGDAEFAWQQGPACPVLEAEVRALELRIGEQFPVGYRSETCRRARPWVAAIARSLSVGAVLLFDYGYERRDYYHPDRSDGTLLCHYRHRVHANPFVLPGLQDITASVDFTGIADAGVAAGLELLGYTTQAWFLIGAGIETMMAEFEPNTPEFVALAHGARTLLLPGEMGERVKVLGFARGVSASLPSFSVRDLRGRL